jgi:hypothetical protein
MKVAQPLKRLMAKIRINETTGCWDWTAGKNRCGYGCFSINRQTRLAHRVSYEMKYGPIREDILVCHSCDNPGCVNPDHLFLGTCAENTADRDAKSRQARGRAHGRAKLADADISAIRNSTDKTQAQLAKLFGVHQSQISLIRSGKRWAAHEFGARDRA